MIYSPFRCPTFGTSVVQRGLTAHSTTDLIFQGDIPEEVRHGLLVVDTPDCLSQKNRDVNGLDLVTLQFLQVMRHSVRHNNLKQN